MKTEITLKPKSDIKRSMSTKKSLVFEASGTKAILLYVSVVRKNILLFNTTVLDIQVAEIFVDLGLNTVP